MSAQKDLGELYSAHVKAMRERADRALAATGFDHLLVFSGSERLRLFDDAPYPFVANPQFKAWLPLTAHPGCFLSYTPGNQPRLSYCQPDDYWYAPPEAPAGIWPGHFDVRVTEQAAAGLDLVPASGRTAILGEFADENLVPRRGEINPPSLVKHLEFQRAWKTGYEIECIKRANSLAADAHRAAEAAFREGCSEYEIHMAYCEACSHSENELPYSSIVALNEHSAVLHYQNWQRQRPASGALFSFLIDAGAGFNGYAADITRSYSAGDADFQSLIDAMNDAQLRLCGLVRPGVDYREVHLAAHREVAGILAESGIVRLAAERIFELGITGTFFPHGVGHYIGLQVHDVGGLMADPDGGEIPRPEGHPFLRLTRRLEPGHVATIEPGLYFIDSLLGALRTGEHAAHVDWGRVDAFRKFGGVRIEDDVAVTADGHENLTRQFL